MSLHDEVVPLGGFKQRAALGLLLLRANRVVATSEMLAALWPEEELPATARKIVQNAVWGLRALLGAPPGHEVPLHSPRPELLTQAPGYMLRVDPDCLDVNRFERQVAEGRARFVAGDAGEAARLLREALAEWRGPALADLAEHGVAWPELTALGQLRLDVMEDRFEAELLCGRHQAVLGELSSLVTEQPLRERLCRQLMLALYRCGRQAEALSVFTRVRRALVEDYGLEPSRELQLLQQSILTHDPALAAPTDTGAERLTLADVRPLRGGPRPEAAAPDRQEPLRDEAHQEPGALRAAAPQTGGTAPQPGDGPAADRPEPGPVHAAAPSAAAPPAHGAPAHGPAPYGPTAPERTTTGRPAGGPVAERRQVSVVLVRTDFTGEAAALGDEHIASALHDAVSAFAESVEMFDGTVVGSLGYVSVALFGLHDDPSTASLNAVVAAFALRDRFLKTDTPGPTFHAVVIAGAALVQHDPHDPTVPVNVAGRLLDDAQTLLSAVPPGEVYVSGDAARVSEARNRHRPTPHPGPVAAHAPEPVHHVSRPSAWADVWDVVPPPPKESADREHELSIATNLLDHCRHHTAPYLMTILGEQAVGKTWFLEEFERRVPQHSPEVRVIRVGATASAGNASRLGRDLLAACCGLPPGAGVDGRFADAVRRMAGPEPAERLLYDLLPLMGPAAWGTSEEEADASWIEVVALAARERPIVLCFDDIHRSEDALLNCVEQLVATAYPAPLFVMASARPELLERRPFWGSGQRHASTLTLERLPRRQGDGDFLTRFTDRPHAVGDTAPPAYFPRQATRWVRRYTDHEPFVARHAER
ncbi:BTAD domain-containing putative transcriptional regulator [Streptomyces acidicola]|uniref:BTAD domain-containing putative transcriptional regulator n=1 Tax=Streptomyces acidicola TaxID=2596892 RepID=UPI00342C2985